MSDQMGANVSGFLYLRRKEGDFGAAAARYLRNPIMLASLAIVFVSLIGLFVVRALGFSPRTQIMTAVETIAGNLCWLPPLIGWWMSRRRDQEDAR